MTYRSLFVIGSLLVGASIVVACSSTEADNSAAGGGGGGGGGMAPSAGASSSDGGADSANSAAGTKSVGAGGAGSTGAEAGDGAGGAAAGAGAGGASASGAGGDAMGGAAAGGATAAGEAGMAGAGGAAPLGPLLKNGSFELGGLAGWQVTLTPNPPDGKGLYVQWGDVGGVQGTSYDGKYELSFWDDMSAYQGDVHQTIGLSPGKYRFSAYVAFGLGINSAYLYAFGCGVEDLQMPLPVDQSIPDFSPFSIPEINVTTAGQCTVGISVDMNPGNWLNADAFVFEPVPAE